MKFSMVGVRCPAEERPNLEAGLVEFEGEKGIATIPKGTKPLHPQLGHKI